MTNGVRLDKIVRYMLSSISILVIGARFGFHLLPCCAYLLALPSLYIYDDKAPGTGTFKSRFEKLFKGLSQSDPFTVNYFNKSS